MAAGDLLHVLGGGPWQMPTIRLAQSLGCRVLVTDIFADRPAYRIADVHHVVDITDMGRTLEIARDHRATGIICDTTDVGVPTAGFVAEQLGLPGMGYQVALNFTNKLRMRQCTERAGIASPRYRVLAAAQAADAAALAREVGYPLVVKPVDNQSGRGVAVARDDHDLCAALAAALRHSRCGNVLLEEAIDGREIIVDGFAVHGQARVLAIARKLPYADNPTICSRIHYPGRLPSPEFERVEMAVRGTIAALGLRNGIFHAEFMVRGDQVIPIDIAARGGGVMIYSHVIPHVAGVNVNLAMVHLALGERVLVEPPARTRAGNVEFFRAPVGRMAAIEGIEAAASMPGIAAIHCNLKPGDLVGGLSQKDDRLGFVVALADTSQEALDRAMGAKSRIRLRMEGDPHFQPVL